MSTEPDMPAAGLAPDMLAGHREVLLRFARLHLRDSAAAEDAVQDTLLSALQSSQDFRGEASVQTWLIGILKRKLIDRFRRQGREVTATDTRIADSDADDDALLTRLFDQSGHWATPPPASWSDPYASLERQGFWDVFEGCVSLLPERQARVFALRELAGLEAAEICKALDISASNYWVLMHRARLRLRECLDRRWFAVPGKGT